MPTIDVDRTRQEIRATFRKWGLDPSEFEIVWQDEYSEGKRVRRLPGVSVRYLRNGVWQTVTCHGFSTRAQNLRRCFFLLDRLRIAEQQGVQYEGLTYTKDVVAADTTQARREELLDAYDTLGVGPDDPIELVKEVYRKKSQYYHPDHKGGDPEKFKRLTQAYERICESRGVAK